MSDLKIFVATHKPYKMPDEHIYIPLHVGKEGKEDLGYQGDNTGDSISFKNPNFCELTGLYWAWKNIECEYIGLSHYRRYFSYKNSLEIFSNKKDKYNLIINEFDTKKIIGDFDIILPKKRKYYVETVWSHYKNAHFINDLEKTKEIICKRYPEYKKSFEKVMNGRELYLYNMFIMRKHDFNEYCNWLFDILFELEAIIDISNYDGYQRRIFGFISERLFNVWVLQKGLIVKELPVVNLESIDWKNKAISFLKRKFEGRR
jgi:hypothetical protein